jgi:hypothetical protein
MPLDFTPIKGFNIDKEELSRFPWDKSLFHRSRSILPDGLFG